MKFSYTLAAVFATAAVAAPVAQAPAVPVDAGLLAKLSPDVAALVTGLGLTSIAPGLAATLVTLSEGLKTRDTSSPEVPVDAGLLAKLSPDVAALVTGLGLTSLAPGLASTLITLSAGLKTRQVEGVVTPVTGVVSDVTKPLGGVVGAVGARDLPIVNELPVAGGVVNEVEGVVGGVLGARDLPIVNDLPVAGGVVNKVTGLVSGLAGGATGAVGARDLPIVNELPVAGGVVNEVEGVVGGVLGARDLPIVNDLPVAGGVVNKVTGLVSGLAGGATGAVGARDLPIVNELPVAGGVVNEVEGVVGGVLGARDGADVPVDAGLLAKLSPDIAALVTGLGLTSLAPGLASTLITLSAGLKTRDTTDLAAELKPAVEALVGQVTGTVENKVVPGVQATVEKVVPAVTGTVEKVTGALGGVGARDAAAVPVDAGLLAKLSPDVAALVTGLGLTSLAPGLASTLITLSEGLKARGESPVPDIPVDAGLLAKLSPDVAALVSGLGLTSIAPGLAATLVTLSEGLKPRQAESVVNTLSTVVTPITEVLSGLTKPLSGAVGARDLPIVNELPVAGGVVNEVEGVVGGVLGARDLPIVNELPVAGGVVNEVEGVVGGVLGARDLPIVNELPVAGGVVNEVEGVVGGVLGARQSSDPLAKVTQALYAILGHVTDVVSGVVKPVEAAVGKVAAPVGAVVGAVGARDAPAVGDVVAQVTEVVKNVTGKVGTEDLVKAASGSVPVDAGLLAQLSAPIAALVSGLGLTSLAPGLASTLITLSQGL